MAKKARKKAVGPTSKARGKTRGKTDAADRIITAALAQAAGRGWRRVQLVDIAIEAGVTLAELRDALGRVLSLLKNQTPAAHVLPMLDADAKGTGGVPNIHNPGKPDKG